MEAQLKRFMALALKEAKHSLKEGNCGFGAVVFRKGEIVASAHDTEKTHQDPTAHAEITAVRAACATLGCDLSECAIVSTHEPCPMCATAILWAGIGTVAYGFSIQEAIRQGRRRIDLPCREIFERAGKPVIIRAGVMHDRCAVLYNRQVRASVAEIRDADADRLSSLAAKLSEKRIKWFQGYPDDPVCPDMDLLDRAYRLFLRKLSIRAENAPIVKRESARLVIHSQNFCPTLEACDILGLDTRRICAHMTETPMDALLKQLSPRLCFSRNYEAIRPHTEYCEEIISLAES